jgi:hypothetical protein
VSATDPLESAVVDAPSELADAMRGAVAGVPREPDAMIDRVAELLSGVVARGDDDQPRELALDLLTVDALTTMTFELASELDANALDAAAARAMHRLGATLPSATT